MENYDWIQWYFICVFAIETIARLINHGQPRANYDFRDFFGAMIVCLPFYGRILGWW